MQQISNVNRSSSPYNFISARTLFSVQPTEPPSSPPPTSPLPPLPEFAPYSPTRSSPTASPVSSSGRPRRPPRPKTSLPDLKPRTIKSPEIARRQRSAESAAQIRSSPPPQRISNIKQENEEVSFPRRRDSVRLLTPTPQSSTSFSEDVLSALPNVFQRSPPRFCSPDGYDGGRPLRAWQVYHQFPSKNSVKHKRQKTETRKPVARTALWIPTTSSNHALPAQQGSSQVHGPERRYDSRVRLLRHATSASHFPPRRSLRGRLFHSSSENNINENILNVHKRSPAVSAFTFDFNQQYTPSAGNTAQSSSENLTSLPRLPSNPTVNTLNTVETQSKHAHSQLGVATAQETQVSSRTSIEELAFFSVPYSHTLSQAGPRPKTAREEQCSPMGEDSLVQECIERPPTRPTVDPETGEIVEERVLTPEQLKKQKRMRMLWAISTVVMVLIATGGILVGIVWKLHNIA